jgi:hypothetical protein
MAELMSTDLIRQVLPVFALSTDLIRQVLPVFAQGRIQESRMRPAPPACVKSHRRVRFHLFPATLGLVFLYTPLPNGTYTVPAKYRR